MSTCDGLYKYMLWDFAAEKVVATYFADGEVIAEHTVAGDATKSLEADTMWTCYFFENGYNQNVQQLQMENGDLLMIPETIEQDLNDALQLNGFGDVIPSEYILECLDLCQELLAGVKSPLISDVQMQYVQSDDWNEFRVAALQHAGELQLVPRAALVRGQGP